MLIRAWPRGRIIAVLCKGLTLFGARRALIFQLGLLHHVIILSKVSLRLRLEFSICQWHLPRYVASFDYSIIIRLPPGTDSSLGKIGNVDFIRRVSRRNLTRVIDILTDDRSMTEQWWILFKCRCLDVDDFCSLISLEPATTLRLLRSRWRH